METFKQLNCMLRLMRCTKPGSGRKIDTRGAQLRRAIRNAINWLNRVRSAAVVRYVERHVVELEKQLRMGNQHEFFQNIKLVQLEETRKVEPQYVCDEKGRVQTA